MKKIFVGILAVGLMGLSLTTSSAEQREELKIVNEEATVGINFFHGTWAEALVKAKKENKLIFLDSYASWCGPCKMMARNTFTDAEVGTFFNKNFINVKMDMEKNADGPRLSRKFGLTAYPSLYFINASETVSHQSLGYQKPNQLIEIGKTALTKK
jgi:thiol:disulfide interchange protein